MLEVKQGIELRPMSYQDLSQVINIERASFQVPWTRTTFKSCMHTKGIICMVLMRKQCTLAGTKFWVIGYVVYALHKHYVDLLSLAISPDERRKGIGSRLVKLLDRKLYFRRSRILADVSEENLEAQLFFKSLGFKAIEIVKAPYDHTMQDAYRMEYTRNEQDC